jgi:hypothetical protein
LLVALLLLVLTEALLLIKWLSVGCTSTAVEVPIGGWAGSTAGSMKVSSRGPKSSR